MTTAPPLQLPVIQQNPLFHAAAVLDPTDMFLLAGLGNGPGSGWVSGAQVQPLSVPDYLVQVSAGVVNINGALITVTANAALAPAAPNVTDRRDIVLVGSNGLPYFKAGTPCTTTAWSVASPGLPPLKPLPDANTVVLAEVYIIGNSPPPVAPITTGAIIDKRTPAFPTQSVSVTEGTLAQRSALIPSPVIGQVYRATDVGLLGSLMLWTGSVWAGVGEDTVLVDDLRLPADPDDTNAFLAAVAISNASTSGAKLVFSSNRTYTITAPPPPASSKVIQVTKNLVLQGGLGTVLKFGPEHATFALIGWHFDPGVVTILRDIEIDGPTDANGQLHIGIQHEPTLGGATGAIILDRNVRMTNWAYCVSALGDVTAATSDNLIRVGPGCSLISNGLGQTIITNGGSVYVDSDAFIDMVGGTGQNHGIYMAPAVSFDIQGRFGSAGGYNVHSFGGASNGTPRFCQIRGAKFLGSPGTAAVLSNALLATLIEVCTFANLTGDAVRTQFDCDIGSSDFTTPNAIVQVSSTATVAHRIAIHDCPRFQRVLIQNTPGTLAALTSVRLNPDSNAEAVVVTVAASAELDLCTLSGGSWTNRQQSVVTAGGAIRMRRCSVNNGARPTFVFGAGGNYSQADVGAAIVVQGAGVAGGDLTTTIVSVQSATKLTVAAGCSSNVSVANVTIAGFARGTGRMDTRPIYGILASASNTTVEGRDNLFEDSTTAWASDNLALGQMRLRESVATGTPVASAGSVVLSPNFDVQHVSGTATIATLTVVDGNASTQRLHCARVSLIADGAWSMSAAGNIIPKTTSPRAVGAMVILQYDSTSAKWYEAA